MNKIHSLAVLVLSFTSAFGYFPYGNPYGGIYPYGGMYPFGAMLKEIESRTISVPDNAPDLLKKFHDLHCLVERYGERCWSDYSISIYKYTSDCEMYVYGGCQNNQTRFYNAEMCNGECRLPSSNDNAPDDGDSASNADTSSALNEPTVQQVNSAGVVPTPVVNPASPKKLETS